jgi:NAD-dependent deacetylase sirtuin 2
LFSPSTFLSWQLPEEFFEKTEADLPNVDLLIVAGSAIAHRKRTAPHNRFTIAQSIGVLCCCAGTSLTVGPANSVVYRVPKHTVRLLVNNEPVGEELGIEYGSKATRDVFAQV